MQYVDACLRSPEAVKMAETMGFAGTGVLLLWEKNVFERIASLRKAHHGVAFGVVLVGNVKAMAKDMRKNIELIAAQDEWREAVETPEVDVVFLEGMNYVMARLAKRNNVAVGFDFSRVLHASRQGRGHVLAHMLAAAALVRKYRLPFLLTSGAHSCWDVRSPSDLIAFGKVLGFQEHECRAALSGSMLQENRKRLGGKWVMPGVESLT